MHWNLAFSKKMFLLRIDIRYHMNLCFYKKLTCVFKVDCRYAVRKIYTDSRYWDWYIPIKDITKKLHKVLKLTVDIVAQYR